jgi:hypothetical protein
MTTDGRIDQHFSVDYTFDDENSTNELQTDHSFFAYFLSAESLTTFPKHIVCVIDVSGSMKGERIQQMQDYVAVIIESLTDEDTFQLITFNDKIVHWPISQSSSIMGTKVPFKSYVTLFRPPPPCDILCDFPSPRPPRVM